MTVDQSSLDELETKLKADIQAAHLASNKNTPMSIDDVASIVRQIITTITGDVTAADLKFYAELRELAEYIRRAKQELADIKPKDISENHIPNATDELDAVVGATEEATNKIMDVCDQITALAGESSAEMSEKLIACTTRIYEACNFQDITGQRITKVVQTLKYIDVKIAALLSALGDEITQESGSLPTPAAVDEDPDRALLNGPQLPQNAIDQDEIDKLLGN